MLLFRIDLWEREGLLNPRKQRGNRSCMLEEWDYEYMAQKF